MPGPIGRAVSTIRTPQLVREHLAKLGAEGDHVSAIHQAVKRRTQELAAEIARERRQPYRYHWPRRHSFQALVGRLLAIGLLEKTGQREDPKGRGAGVLGTDRGWRQRVWIRLAPGNEDSPAWENPMGQSTTTPLSGITTLIAEPPTKPPRPPRPQPRPPAEEEVAAQDLGPRVERLERDRKALVQRLAAASEVTGRVEDFEALHQAARRFLGSVSAVYDVEQFPDAPEAMEQLANCIRLFALDRGMTQRRVQALRNCQNWARLLAESLGNVLVIPTGAPSRPRRGPRRVAADGAVLE